VIYTGFALPARPGDRVESVDQGALAKERADLPSRTPTMPYSPGAGGGAST
jgi:hypothetical protein